MNFDKNRVDETVLALLHLTTFSDRGFNRAWKGQDWDVMNRLYEKGFIGDPKSKAKSVAFTEEGARRSRELFYEMFGTA